MRAVSFITAILNVAIVANVAAQIDPDPDGIGVYFDLEATQVVAMAEEGEFVTAYLFATNISQPGGVVFWEASIEPNITVPPDDPAAWAGYIYGAPVDSYNYAMNVPGDPSWHCIAMPQPPLPVAPLTLLAYLSIHILDGSYPIALYVTYDPLYSVVGTDGPYHDLFHSSGAEDLPVAVINGQGPIAAQAATWSQLKSLYR